MITKRVKINVLLIIPLLLSYCLKSNDDHHSEADINDHPTETETDINDKWIGVAYSAFEPVYSGIICFDSLRIGANNTYRHYFEFAPNDCDTGNLFYATIKGEIAWNDSLVFSMNRTAIIDSGYYKPFFGEPIPPPFIYKSILCKMENGTIYFPVLESVHVTPFNSHSLDTSQIDDWYEYYRKNK